MKLVMPDCPIESMIDHQLADTDTVMALPQQTAYPGGHFYVIRVHGCARLLLPGNVSYCEYNPVGRALSRQILTRLHLTIAARRTMSAKALCWVLNTVHSIVYSHEEYSTIN